MYALLTSKESGLPTVVSTNSLSYTDLIMSGMYNEEDTGTKNEMQEKESDIIAELYAIID